MKKIVCLLMVLFLLTGCQNSKATVEDKHRELLASYLENLKAGNTKKAMENVMFSKGEIEAGVPEVFCSAMEEFDYKSYHIKNITKLNDSIYLANVIVNTNFDSQDKTKYVDVEFNPYIVSDKDEYKLTFVKEYVPKDLYGDLTTLPNNYNDGLEYLVAKEDSIGDISR